MHVSERLDALEQRRGVPVEVDEGAATPFLQPARLEVELGLIELLRAEDLAVEHESVLAIHVEAPAVERADEAGVFAIAVTAGELDAAMAARIVEGFHARFGADDDDRLVEDPVLDPVADLRNLFQPGRHLPHLRPEILALEVVERLVVITLRRNPFGIGDLERHFVAALRALVRTRSTTSWFIWHLIPAGSFPPYSLPRPRRVRESLVKTRHA